jgi:hypothetical protein
LNSFFKQFPLRHSWFQKLYNHFFFF